MTKPFIPDHVHDETLPVVRFFGVGFFILYYFTKLFAIISVPAFIIYVAMALGVPTWMAIGAGIYSVLSITNTLKKGRDDFE